ncbi:putative ABC transporter substrate-binding protein [Gordonia hirsuta DSM 44140 = NBRC 16056]|uniref:Putative ABC transporter substrate-binding protein n=1 Tax=Gordonia hirsuta DSM 44140 = NBRC 16056 TaxID=1121927 RepID=L7L518_9ACTN|nr:thiamine ABC transporter substrate-binding protein [Gordonia hirsuta]GAC56240.1 putative ABC transporter substrate-binding protein [Gordonia hirsuta DSM 44140 = NBRC 16056]
MKKHFRRLPISLLAVGALVATLTACTSDSPDTTVTVLTHDSFSLPQRLIDDFAAESGLKVDFVRSGDAGQLSSVVSLSAGKPKGDAVFGIDNTFAARPIEAEALEPYLSPLAAGGADRYAVPESKNELTAIDRGDVCLNVDDQWYERENLPAPTSLADLRESRYADQAVLLDPATSSPGMSFLLATIGTYKDKAPDYWRALMDNGAQVVSGWEIAYNQLFSAGEGHGSKPIVVSYASSPAATPGTSAILSGCFSQIEYMGILRGAANPDGARKVIDWMLSPAVQTALPTSMFVYPVQEGTPLPQDWQRRAPAPQYTVSMSPQYINDNREQWLKEWRETVRR